MRPQLAMAGTPVLHLPSAALLRALPKLNSAVTSLLQTPPHPATPAPLPACSDDLRDRTTPAHPLAPLAAWGESAQRLTAVPVHVVLLMLLLLLLQLHCELREAQAGEQKTVAALAPPGRTADGRVRASAFFHMHNRPDVPASDDQLISRCLASLYGEFL